MVISQMYNRSGSNQKTANTFPDWSDRLLMAGEPNWVLAA